MRYSRPLFPESEPHAHVEIQVERLLLIDVIYPASIVEIIADARLGIDSYRIGEIKLHTGGGIH